MRSTKLALGIVALATAVATGFAFNSLTPFLRLQVLGQSRETSKSEVERLWNLCREQFKKNQFQAVLQSCQQAATTAQTTGDRLIQARSLVNLGAAYLNTGNTKQAIAHYEQALPIAQAIKNPDLEARVLTGLGAAYRNLGNYDQAIKYHQQVLNIARQNNHPQSELWALGNLGIIYNERGDYTQAIEYYEKVLAIAQQIPDPQSEGVALFNLGLAYNSLSDYQQAIEYYQKSLTIARKINNPHDKGQALGGLGNAYHSLGEYKKAIEYTQQSLTIARQINNPQNEGNALGGLGNAYNSLKEYKKANEYYQQWLTIARRINSPQSEVRALLGLGLSSVWLGNYDEAIAYNQKSLAITRQIQDRYSEGSALGNIGLAYHYLGEYAKAMEYHQKSLAIAQQIKDRQGQGRALNNLGYALQKSGKLSEAEKILFEGVVVWERQRERLDSNDALKVSIFEEQSRTYTILQKVLIAQKKIDKALEIAERGRARAFIELLQRRAELKQKAEYINSSPNIELLKQTAKQQNTTLVQYSIIYDDFKVKDKRQFKESDLYIWVIKPTGEVEFRSFDLKPLWQQQNSSVENLVTKTLESLGVALNSRSPNNQQSFAVEDFVRRNNGEDSPKDPAWKVVAVNPQNRTLKIWLPTWKDTDEPIEIKFAEVTKVSSSNKAYTELQQLHKLLIDRIADLLPKDPNARVTFIPQGSLFFVPFPALQDADRKYLIQKHTILTAPSIQVLDLTRQKRQKISGTLKNVPRDVLVVGNPTMPKVSLKVEEDATQLPPLPASENEAKEVAQIYKTNAIIGNKATKSAILPLFPKARIIHLATHGLLNDFTGRGIPGAVALAPDSQDNGLLTASEILDLKLNNTELVVLSACTTGVGKITGDGVIGLSRSLISAGVPSVIVSLWLIPDTPTASLMRQFYQQLEQGDDKASALRKAMLATMEQHPDPQNWAAFTLIGESN
jgi:CHAT domain-containing protein/tetratricopeptide (TPR) repeat protein